MSVATTPPSSRPIPKRTAPRPADRGRLLGVLLVTLATSAATSAAAASRAPLDDVVRVSAPIALSDTQTVPGLAEGKRIAADLDEARELLRAHVPRAARRVLVALRERLDELRRDAPERLPARYHQDSDWWLPVRAERLTFGLDAPRLQPRPHPRPQSVPLPDPTQQATQQATTGDRPAPGATRDAPANLDVAGLRVRWMPLRRNERRVATAIERLAGGLGSDLAGQSQAQALLQAAGEDLRVDLSLERAPLLDAYYQLEALLTSVPPWHAGDHDRLRALAESLADSEAGLSGRLTQLANRATPSRRELRDLAREAWRNLHTAPTRPTSP